MTLTRRLEHCEGINSQHELLYGGGLSFCWTILFVLCWLIILVLSHSLYIYVLNNPQLLDYFNFILSFTILLPKILAGVPNVYQSMSAEFTPVWVTVDKNYPDLRKSETIPLYLTEQIKIFMTSEEPKGLVRHTCFGSLHGIFWQ